MDWVLSFTTLAVNFGLGWSRGAWWMWLLHGMNAALWILYSLAIGQNGLIVMSGVTVIVDLICAYKQHQLALGATKV